MKFVFLKMRSVSLWHYGPTEHNSYPNSHYSNSKISFIFTFIGLFRIASNVLFMHNCVLCCTILNKKWFKEILILKKDLKRTRHVSRRFKQTASLQVQTAETQQNFIWELEMFSLNSQWEEMLENRWRSSAWTSLHVFCSLTFINHTHTADEMKVYECSFLVSQSKHLYFSVSLLCLLIETEK